MQAYRLEMALQQNGILVLNNLPLQADTTVEVIILVKPSSLPHLPNRYPLRGLPITYVNPTEPVAQTDWEVMQ